METSEGEIFDWLQGIMWFSTDSTERPFVWSEAFMLVRNHNDSGERAKRRGAHIHVVSLKFPLKQLPK